MFKELVDEAESDLAAHGLTLKADAAAAEVSRAKSRGQSPAAFRAAGTAAPSTPSAQLHRIIAGMYDAYQAKLREVHALDFDDLLMQCAALFRAHPSLASHIDHGTWRADAVLVDEFQDTNAVQYELMRLMAAAGCVSVVGDPDQSIYSACGALIQAGAMRTSAISTRCKWTFQACTARAWRKTTGAPRRS